MTITNEAHMAEEGNKMNEHEPQETPPIEDSVMAGVEEARPKEMIEELPPLAEAMPLETPPNLEATVSEAFGAAVWHSAKKITRLWSINQNRNSWITISGIGWRKLANNSDSAIVALSMLAAHAKQMGGNANLKEDSGQIKEIYVW